MVEPTKLKKPTAEDDAAANDDPDTPEENQKDDDKPGPGHNSDTLKKTIVECATLMAGIDSERKELNRRASDVREVLSDYGIDKEAFREAYGYYKKKMHERDGFDDSSKLCHEALSDPEQKDLFDVLKDAA